VLVLAQYLKMKDFPFNNSNQRKPIRFLGKTEEVLSLFPKEVKRKIGFALNLAQNGEQALNTKALVGFRGNKEIEVIADFDGNTYRAAYTVRFEDLVYVLHVFQKKSKSGIATPKEDIELIKNRLKLAEEDYKARKGTK
jgi:phage-related protein